MVLASRAEMNQVYLKPLVPYLKPKFLREKGGSIFFDDAKAEVDWDKFQESLRVIRPFWALNLFRENPCVLF